jgi:hypothetical protein
MVAVALYPSSTFIFDIEIAPELCNAIITNPYNLSPDTRSGYK